MALQLGQEARRQVDGGHVEALAHLDAAQTRIVSHLHILQEAGGHGLQRILWPALGGGEKREERKTTRKKEKRFEKDVEKEKGEGEEGGQTVGEMEGIKEREKSKDKDREEKKNTITLSSASSTNSNTNPHTQTYTPKLPPTHTHMHKHTATHKERVGGRDASPADRFKICNQFNTALAVMEMTHNWDYRQ